MKKLSLLLVVAIVAVACQPDLPPLPSEKAATTGATASAATSATTGATSSAATSSKTTTSTTGASSATTTSGGSTATTTGSTATTTTDTSKGQQLQKGDIPRRIFQLRTFAHTTIGGARQPIDALVADDDFKVEEGLMWVTDKDLKDDQGMIFVFANPSPQSFWMRNTLIPLDIVYIAQDGKVLNIVHGKPKDETSLKSTGPAKYVLELKDGTASRLGIAPGSKLIISADVQHRGEDDNQQPGMSIPGQ